MKPLLNFIKQYLKLILTISVILFVSIFIILFLYEQNRKNTLLEKRLNKLETLKKQSISSPDQIYAESRVLVKNQKYDAALEKLLQLKSNYPYWHTKMVNSSITVIKQINEKQDKAQSELEQKLDQLASSENPEALIDRNSEVVTTGGEKKFKFRKFEYQDTKFPLKTSNSGYSRENKTGITKNSDGSITGASNDFAFKKFDFEDKRYKKNIKPVPDGSQINSQNKNSSRSKKDFKKHEFEDDRYKKKISPAVKKSSGDKTAKDTLRKKKKFNYEDPRYKK